jgi:hypothetical protein
MHGEKMKIYKGIFRGTLSIHNISKKGTQKYVCPLIYLPY